MSYFIEKVKCSETYSELSQVEYQQIINIEKENHDDGFKFLQIGVRGEYDYNDKDYRWFVTKENGRVVAYVLLDIERSDFVYFDDIGVSKYHKNLGHGTKLIEKVLKWKSECEDSRPLVLKVARANIGAVKLYKKFGFVETDAPDPKWHIADDHFWLTF